MPDQNLYSLESGPFPFVLFCPAGFNCGSVTLFQMVCCNQIFSVVIPVGASAAQQQSLIGGVVSACNQVLPFCGGNQCVNPPCGIYLNSPQTCTVDCPDGTEFSFTTPAGTFGVAAIGSVTPAQAQNEANVEASAYACQQAGLRKMCFNPFAACVCQGVAFSQQVSVTGGVAPITFSLFSGSLPGGLLMGADGTIAGVPTTSGVFNFTVQATSAADNSFTRKGFSITVLNITTSSLPPFSVGTPYSAALTVVGGSGNYSWNITAGQLPDGLFLSPLGIIFGTPTGLNFGSSPITFQVVDTRCEVATQIALPPMVTISTKSTTQIATILGWSEFPGFVSSPPKKFKVVSWTGSSEQQLWYTTANGFGPVGNPSIQRYITTDPNTDGIVPPSQTAPNQFCVQSGSQSYIWNTTTKLWVVAPDQTAVQQIGGARYDFSGIDQIDEFGNVINQHSKLLSVMCNSGGRANIIGPTFSGNNAFVLAAPFTGYFGTNKTFFPQPFGPTELCSSASIPYQGLGNIAAGSPFQYPAADLVGLWGSGFQSGADSFLGQAVVKFLSNSNAASNDTGASGVFINAYAFPLVPPGLLLLEFSALGSPTLGFIPTPPDWANAQATVLFINSFSANLQSEYTDAEALTNALVIQGNGNIAANLVRTTGFVSTFTTVVYTLSMSGLINGRSYNVSVDFADLTAGTSTTQTVAITATGPTQTIISPVPTPIAGHIVEVRNPRITFA